MCICASQLKAWWVSPPTWILTYSPQPVPKYQKASIRRPEAGVFAQSCSWGLLTRKAKRKARDTFRTYSKKPGNSPHWVAGLLWFGSSFALPCCWKQPTDRIPKCLSSSVFLIVNVWFMFLIFLASQAHCKCFLETALNSHWMYWRLGSSTTI